MTIDRFEEVFLRGNAGKHFIALTYRLRRGADVRNDHISCFVVELAGTWFLLTAGALDQGRGARA